MMCQHTIQTQRGFSTMHDLLISLRRSVAQKRMANKGMNASRKTRSGSLRSITFAHDRVILNVLSGRNCSVVGSQAGSATITLRTSCSWLGFPLYTDAHILLGLETRCHAERATSRIVPARVNRRLWMFAWMRHCRVSTTTKRFALLASIVETPAQGILDRITGLT